MAQATTGAPFSIGRRLIVVGTAGTGKSTVAKRLAHHLGVPHVELDAFFHEANWVSASLRDFRERTRAATAGDGWIVDGNYGSVRDLVWPRAELAIWLDYPLHVALRRVTWRTLRRIVANEVIFNGNRETWENAVFKRDGLIMYVIKSHSWRRREFAAAFQQPENAHLKLLRFRSTRDTGKWLNQLERVRQMREEESRATF